MKMIKPPVKEVDTTYKFHNRDHIPGNARSCQPMEDAMICAICEYSPDIETDCKDHASGSRHRMLNQLGRILCSTCAAKENEALTTYSEDDTLIYEVVEPTVELMDGVEVKVYPPTAPELRYYAEYGVTEEQKEQWRTDYDASLKCTGSKPGSY